jgi:CheY-like chemotaxis protein
LAADRSAAAGLFLADDDLSPAILLPAIGLSEFSALGLEGTNLCRLRWPSGSSPRSSAMGRILLVEDDVDVLFLLEHILRAAGHHVDGASTRQRAEDLVNRDGYDLVVADGKLDDGTGMMVADKAAAKGSKGLIITGHAAQLPRRDLLRYPYLRSPSAAMSC